MQETKSQFVVVHARIEELDFAFTSQPEAVIAAGATKRLHNGTKGPLDSL